MYILVIIFTMLDLPGTYERTFETKEACNVAATLLTADIREKGGVVSIADCRH